MSRVRASSPAPASLRVLQDRPRHTLGEGEDGDHDAGAAEVTGVDLDEVAIAQAKRNANLNQARIKFVHADAFA